MQLRWGAVVGQLAAISIARLVFDWALPYGTLLGLVTFTALSNGLLRVLDGSSPRNRTLFAVLSVDAVVLTLMLAAAGGASNPFSIFFLIHVALAALLLESPLAWGVVGLTVVGFGGLFFVPGVSVFHHEHGAALSHLVGMWIAYVFAAGFIAHFVGKVSRAIRERDRRLHDAVKLAAQNERLATLSSFSANAAHELGSPLSTIGLAAKELAIALKRENAGGSLVADAELVCREVARCREILASLSARAGESVGEMPVATTPARIVEALMRLTDPAQQADISVQFVDNSSADLRVVAPVKTLAQMLHNLVRNAIDANQELRRVGPVELLIHARDYLSFSVLDRGPGMPADLQSCLGEPFVTTKSQQGGLGLGFYLARSFAERAGGQLIVRARVGGGAEVELSLPNDPVQGCA